MTSSTRRLLFGLLLGATSAIIYACRVSAPSPSPSAEDAAKFVATVNETMLKLGSRAAAGRLGLLDLHHGGHRGDQRAGEPGLHRRRRALREGGRALRQRRGAARRAASAQSAEAVAGHRHAVGSEGGRGADDAGRVDGGGLRPRQVVPGPGEAGDLPGHRGDHRGDGDVARPSGCARPGKAGTRSRRRCGRTTRASRAGEQGRQGAGLRRHRRDVAREVRHAARRVHARNSIGCGSRCGRSTSRCTPTCG